MLQNELLTNPVLLSIVRPFYNPVTRDILIGGGGGLILKAGIDLIWHKWALGENPYALSSSLSAKFGAYKPYLVYGAFLGAIFEPAKALGEAAIQFIIHSLYSKY